MSEKCFYPNCGVLTDNFCGKCKRPLCNSCERYPLCVDCKVIPVNSNNNRLSRKRKRKVPPDVASGDTDHTLEQQELLCQSLPHPQELNVSEQDELSQSLPDLRKQRKNCVECKNCHAFVTYLRKHLKAHEACANYYREQLGIDDVDAIANTLIKENRNRNRADKRRNDLANGNPREKRRQQSFQECWGKHVDNVSNMFEVSCVWCHDKFNNGKGINRIPDDDDELCVLLGQYPHLRDEHTFDNSLWRCNNCEIISKRLIPNQTLSDCLLDLLKLEDDDVDRTVLLMSYKELSELNRVIFPKLKGAPAELAICDDDENVEKRNTTKVMIPNRLCRLSSDGSIEPEVAQLFVNRTDIDTPSLTTALYKDIDKKMKQAETDLESDKENTKVGSVENDIVNFEENRNSHEYRLKKIRCTEAHHRNLISENLAKQAFNGKQNLTVDMKIPMDGLAKVMVKEIYALAGEDIPIVTRYYTDDRGNKHAHELVPCRNENNFCDVRHCDNTEVEHQTAVDWIEERWVGGVDALPKGTSAIACRFLHKYVKSVVEAIIGKLTIHFHIQLEHKVDGSVHMVGNVWIQELVPYNETGELLRDVSVIPEFFTEDLEMELLQEKRELSWGDCDKVSEETSRHVEMNDWKQVREGTLKELICVSGRGFKSVWTDQAVVKLNVRNPTNMKQLFRKKRPEEDENEVIFVDEHGGEWVLIGTMRVKFLQKPDPVKHVSFAQFGAWYKNPDTRYGNTDKDLQMQQLTENNGVLGESQIRIHTNLHRYPHELEYLPEWILLSNGRVMKLRDSHAVIEPTGRLDHFGMRVLCEPFESEEELLDEQDLPDIGTLTQRLKQLFPSSKFEVNT